MLCEEVEVSDLLRFGLDARKTQEAYRKAIVVELIKYQIRGFLAERKGQA